MPVCDKPPKLLLDSLASKPAPKWMVCAGIALGAVLLYRAAVSFYSGGYRDAVLNLVLGLICVYGSGISRSIYLADAGIVREMRSWGRVTRRITVWDDVRHVSLTVRGGGVTAFFETGVKGWRVPFSAELEGEIIAILDEMLPDGVEINKLEKR